MILSRANRGAPGSTPRKVGKNEAPRQASVLIIVLWVAFGLVSIALYFAQTMSFELRAADNRVANLEAEQAIAGAMRYVSNLLATSEVKGMVPPIQTYLSEGVVVGNAAFWLLGRADLRSTPETPVFGLMDEAARLNLNTATLEMLQMLPHMTPELAAAIIDWRDADSTVSAGGAETDLYQRLNPPYRCKNALFESIDELRLVYGMNSILLYGEDANRNGALDPNETDGDASAPYDNRDNTLDPGLLEYVTVWSREPNTRTNGEPRVNVGGTNQQALASLLQEKGFSTDRANEVLRNVGAATAGGGGGGRPGESAAASAPVRSVLEFFVRSGMTAQEFWLIETDITVSTNQYTEGLVNVNTASEAVLACLPGIGLELAPSLVSYRQSNRSSISTMPSVTWVAEVIGPTNVITAGPNLTGQSYQFTADIAAVGHHGRGYQRVRAIFDTSEGSPRLWYRQDLSHQGWALGREARETLLLAGEKR